MCYGASEVEHSENVVTSVNVAGSQFSGKYHSHDDELVRFSD